MDVTKLIEWLMRPLLAFYLNIGAAFFGMFMYLKTGPDAWLLALMSCGNLVVAYLLIQDSGDKDE